MGKEMSNELGQINIANEVIAIIAGIAATECYGLVGMASRSIQDGIAELLGRENITKGVEVEINGDRVDISLYIMVEYGTKITEVANNVIEKVHYVVEKMTGLKVGKVDVVVQGVRVPTKEEKR